jgi:hypothetical protein
MKTLLVILFACFVQLAFYDYSLNQKISMVGFEPTQDQKSTHREIPYARAAGSLGAMLFGILFGSVYDRIREAKGEISIIELGAAFASAHLYKAVLVSPLVYVGVYITSGSQPDVVIASLFAFQNGFFCHSIFLNKKEESPS